MEFLSVPLSSWALYAALLVAGFTASYKFQFQSLYYILAVAYGVQSVNQWLFVTFIHLTICLFSGFWRGTTK